jgi:hypothetical protein
VDEGGRFGIGLVVGIKAGYMTDYIGCWVELTYFTSPKWSLLYYNVYHPISK